MTHPHRTRRVVEIVHRIERLSVREVVALREMLDDLWGGAGEGGAGVREPRPQGPSPSLEAEAAQHRAWDDE